MTGIMLPSHLNNGGKAYSKDDTPTKRYELLKQIPERYSIVQLGICLFEQRKDEDEYDNDDVSNDDGEGRKPTADTSSSPSRNNNDSSDGQQNSNDNVDHAAFIVVSVCRVVQLGNVYFTCPIYRTSFCFVVPSLYYSVVIILHYFHLI